MKKIELTQGKFAKVDDSDYKVLKKYKWMAVKDTKTFYAARHSIGGTRKLIYMHRTILKTPDKLKTDHIDCDGLNNQRNNLRICTDLQNGKNKSKPSNNISGFKGVIWYKRSKKWRAFIGLDNKQIHLGYFSDKIKAYNAYCEASKKYHKEFSKII